MDTSARRRAPARLRWPMMLALLASLALLAGACAGQQETASPDAEPSPEVAASADDADDEAEGEADADADAAERDEDGGGRDDGDGHDDGAAHDDGEGHDDGESVAGDVQTRTVQGSEFSFEPAELTVEAGRPVAVTYENVGEVQHDWVLLGPDGSELAHAHAYPGETATAEFTLEPGTYDVVCTEPGHADAGMQGTVTAE